MPLSLGGISGLTQHWGVGGLWKKKGRHLPAYIKQIADDLREGGMEESRAIATAIATCKRWAAGGKNVKPETRAKAAAAIAEWERLKASAHHARSEIYDQYRPEAWALDEEATVERTESWRMAVAGGESGSGARGAKPVVGHRVKSKPSGSGRGRPKSGSGSGYNASEPRDVAGKWTTGGGSSGKKSQKQQGLKRGEGMYGPPSARVRSMQELLKRLGYNLGKGGADGRFGPDTQAALKQFQGKNHLPQSGVADHQTLSAMRSRANTKASSKPVGHASSSLHTAKPSSSGKSSAGSGGRTASKASSGKASASSAPRLSQSKDDVRQNGLKWGGKTFHSPAEFKKWLNKRGESWSQFAKNHPDAAAGLTSRAHAPKKQRTARPAASSSGRIPHLNRQPRMEAERSEEIEQGVERAMNVGVYTGGRGLRPLGGGGFNPREPRDKQGRWTKGGGGFLGKLEKELHKFGKQEPVKTGGQSQKENRAMAKKNYAKTKARNDFLDQHIADLRYVGGGASRREAAALTKMRLGQKLTPEEKQRAMSGLLDHPIRNPDHALIAKQMITEELGGGDKVGGMGGGATAKIEHAKQDLSHMANDLLGPGPHALTAGEKSYLDDEMTKLDYFGGQQDTRVAGAMRDLRRGLTLNPDQLELLNKHLGASQDERAKSILKRLYPGVMLANG